MSKIDKLQSSESWQASVRVVEDFLKTKDKLDLLFNRHIGRNKAEISRRVQYLSYGVVRNLGRLQGILRSSVRKAPKKRLQAMLLVSMFEWLEAEEDNRPQIVHYAVEQAKNLLSKPEGRFVNAVMRRFPDLGLEKLPSDDSAKSWSSFYSHPKWLLDRWVRQFGKEDTLQFLSWNQSAPKVYAWSPVCKSELPADWEATQWNEFYEVQAADWSTTRAILADGIAYIQDPSTRMGPSLLEGLRVNSVLDLCAAPGGKSIQLQRYFHDEGGILVSVDLAGPRFERLKENLLRYKRSNVQQVQVAGDVLNLVGKDLPQPEFDAVYLDVPCSNTGVLQRRPDVKWRQNEGSLEGLLALQLALLTKAAEFVAPDGYLIYSTCSVDACENDEMVDTFLRAGGKLFSNEAVSQSLPWKSGHDGAGAFLLKKSK